MTSAFLVGYRYDQSLRGSAIATGTGDCQFPSPDDLTVKSRGHPDSLPVALSNESLNSAATTATDPSEAVWSRISANPGIHSTNGSGTAPDSSISTGWWTASSVAPRVTVSDMGKVAE